MIEIKSLKGKGGNICYTETVNDIFEEKIDERRIMLAEENTSHQLKTSKLQTFSCRLFDPGRWLICTVQ